MARPLRILFDGAWYHVMNRGASRKNIFKNNHDKEAFITLLANITNLKEVALNLSQQAVNQVIDCR